MMVLLQHQLLLLPVPERTLFYRLEFGAVAVTAFLALSGFIVCDALHRFYAGRPVAFLVNRLLRIVPPYLIMLLLTIAVDSWLFSRGRLAPPDGPLSGSPWGWRMIIAGFLEIIPGLTPRRIEGQGFSFIPFAWTLRLEMAFYLAATFAVWCPGLGRLRGPASAALAYTAFFLFVLSHGKGPQQLLCVPFFAFGICAFRASKKPSLPAIAHLLGVSALIPLAFSYWGQRGDPLPAAQLPLLCLLLGLLLLLARADQLGPRIVQWDRWFGALSYPLYIGHGLVLTVFCSLALDPGWRLYAAGAATSLLLAFALHHLAETPVQRLRDRVRGVPV
jgi:peptidoglycan/LPS O-acetylase OafA/YrhL